MNKTMAYLFMGLFSGIIITILVIFKISPGIILKEGTSSYNFEQSLTLLDKEIEGSGWKIPAKHDLQQTLLKHGKEKVNKVVIYEICNPDLAEKILKTDDERVVSNLMPCRIAVYEKSDGKTYFSRMNSGLLSRPMGKITRQQMKIAASEVEKFLSVLN